jgi:2-polyprenyl-3-methyl-5-hydroxy-6-metoxy-1,4-benzoquinol methylase
MDETEANHERSIPSWAKQAHEAWQSAIEATRHLQEVYNQWLSKVDQAHAIPTVEDSIPRLQQLQEDMNQLQNLLGSFKPGMLHSGIEPFLTQQKDLNARAVQLMNEVLEYFRSSSRQLQELMTLQVQYFQQITPWLDAKIHELRMEENHNVTYHVGNIIRAVDAINIQQHTLQAQLKTNERKLDEFASWIQGKLEENVSGIERHSVPEIMPQFYELEEMRTKLAAVKASMSQHPPVPARSMPSNNNQEADFRYHVFEKVFRGSSEGIKESLRKYLPYFENSPEPILDIGCGRGEFVQLMKESGKEAYGIDLNEYAIEQVESAGMKGIVTDILDHLEGLEDNSIGGVFCAQVVEHLHPETAYRMLKSLNRVMKSGSRLVIETVNPLSVFGYHHLYFKDPTHIFPVHPETLVFMMRYSGFQEVNFQMITPVPFQQMLQPPKKEYADGPLYEYLKGMVDHLNHLLYDSLEYYAVGLHA